MVNDRNWLRRDRCRDDNQMSIGFGADGVYLQGQVQQHHHQAHELVQKATRALGICCREA